LSTINYQTYLIDPQRKREGKIPVWLRKPTFHLGDSPTMCGKLQECIISLCFQSFITFCCPEGKNNGLLKFQQYLVNYNDKQQDKQITFNDCYSDFMEKNITGAYLINDNYITSAIGGIVSLCSALIRAFIKVKILASKKAVAA